MASAEEFLNSGKEVGVETWRIEDFKPVKQGPTAFGKFYTGDSYIILNTKQAGGGKVSHDIHFWQGKESSQDDTGASAILAEQLDAAMGGKPKEFREVQGSESPEFLQIFKGGVKYLAGGAASGFHHHEDAPHKAALFHAKGVRVTEVPLGGASLNSGDVFILDNGAKIFVWTGASASPLEKNKALTHTIALRDDKDHQGKSQVIHLEEGDVEGEDATDFFAALGASDPKGITFATA
ncbi:actin depolymerizing protein [Coccomyxa subellipsoidea C-169]|uniref:Actin depolymerizing protein n=1 Tax=Coccomyxa subellipsoidea (strain C-169) TaxID=574566 RepID=I0YPX6_COCSC|nr:actin depolymerizing protein [Coccomyxa subellipsoidea C-169]EIE20445.1 actin depolymerizing protein [Coccomyxa subellipsoidea C-169]|eukprot:XP_005644989.1 actin depolymerizing protein [Coccomyxa subellipsoidea C-169]